MYGMQPDLDYDPSEDYVHDSKGNEESAEGMQWPDFYDALFELADLWSESCRAREYVEILDRVLEEAKEEERRTGLWSRMMQKFGEPLPDGWPHFDGDVIGGGEEKRPQSSLGKTSWRITGPLLVPKPCSYEGTRDHLRPSTSQSSSKPMWMPTGVVHEALSPLSSQVISRNEAKSAVFDPSVIERLTSGLRPSRSQASLASLSLQDRPSSPLKECKSPLRPITARKVDLDLDSHLDSHPPSERSISVPSLDFIYKVSEGGKGPIPLPIPSPLSVNTLGSTAQELTRQDSPHSLSSPLMWQTSHMIKGKQGPAVTLSALMASPSPSSPQAREQSILTPEQSEMSSIASRGKSFSEMFGQARRGCHYGSG